MYYFMYNSLTGAFILLYALCNIAIFNQFQDGRGHEICLRTHFMFFQILGKNLKYVYVH